MSAPGQAEVQDPALRTPTSTHFLCSEGLASHVRGRAPAWEENIAISPCESRLQNPRALRPKPPGRDRQPRSAQSRKLSFARHLQRPLSLDNLRATGIDPAALLARDFVWLRFLGPAYGREALRPAPSPGSAPLVLLTLGAAYGREALRPAPNFGSAPQLLTLGTAYGREALRPAPQPWIRPLVSVTLGTAYGREALRPAPSPGSAPLVSPPGLGHVLAQALFHCVLRDSSHFLFPYLAVFTFDNFDQKHYARHHKRHKKSVNKA